MGGPMGGIDALAQAGDAVMRPAERFRKQLRGQSHIVQHHIGVQGGVAEQ